jgi:uncharacterized membrane protein (UPF0127 family)
MESINIVHQNYKINLKIKPTGFFSRGVGLMFRTRKTTPLLFDFQRDSRASITSYFVLFPFLALWLDKNNRVVEHKIIQPWKLKVKPRNKFRKLVEVPINNKNIEIINHFRR